MKKLTLTLLFILGPRTVLSLTSYDHQEVLSVFISTVLLWFTEIIPLPLTGLLVPILAILFGAASSADAFAPFGNQILFLFMGSFFMAKAMEKHGLDKRIAFTLLASRWGAKGLKGVLLQISILCWLLSMWISNTATCAIVVPIVTGLLTTLKESLTEKEGLSLERAFLLTCAFASSIGGMATPVGSPPNLMALQFLRDKGIELSFIDWMFRGVPVSLTMLIALYYILTWKFPFPNQDLSKAKEHFTLEKNKLGPIGRAEGQIMVVFSCAIFLWVLPGLAGLLLPKTFGPFVNQLKALFPMGGVGILVSSFLFFLSTDKKEFIPNLNWSEANEIDWGIIWLFGGGLTMGALLDKSGLANALGGQLFGGGLSFTLLALLIVIAGVLLSEFSSNTASTAILVPLILGSLGTWGNEMMTALIIAAAFGASFGFMLPVSTPPNAIVYGTGRVPLKEMVRTGVTFDIVGALVIWVFLTIGVTLFS